jgi:integrase
MLPVRERIARAFTAEEQTMLLAEARKRKSPNIYPALSLALNTGMRDKELRTLTWGQVDLVAGVVTVGLSKTAGSSGRMIPLNSAAHAALVAHSKWFLARFGEQRDEWFVFCAGVTSPSNPTKPVSSFKDVWQNIKRTTNIVGRFHDMRHSFISGLAESGQVSDQTIMDIAGHVSRSMLRHYSHLSMQAKRRAVDTLIRPSVLTSVVGDADTKAGAIPSAATKESSKVERVN